MLARGVEISVATGGEGHARLAGLLALVESPVGLSEGLIESDGIAENPAGRDPGAGLQNALDNFSAVAGGEVDADELVSANAEGGIARTSVVGAADIGM